MKLSAVFLLYAYNILLYISMTSILNKTAKEDPEI